MTGIVFRIARFAVHDGPGIRTTVFLKGCPLRCWWCHSPESQSREPELAIHEDRCTRCGTCLPFCPQEAIGATMTAMVTDRDACLVCGACVRACPTGAREIVGTEFTPDALVAEIAKDQLFYDESGGGVTFSGGEPTLQAAFLEQTLALCRARGIRTAVDTCGLADSEAIGRISQLTDLFLFDLKVIDEGRHREVTGASNARILANFRMLAGSHRRIRVRFPLVPGVTDSDDNVEAVAALVQSVGLSHVDVLPYHRAGLAKYARFGVDCRLADVQPPSPERVADVVARLERHGLVVQAGG